MTNKFRGDGYDQLSLPLSVSREGLLSAYIATLFSAATISCAKFSALLMYVRIFNTDPNFRIWVRITGLFCLAWLFGASFGAAFRCTPIQSQWNIMLVPKSKCYKIQNFFLSVEVPNCILDIVVVALPIFMINKLQLSFKHKILLGFSFVLGGLSVVQAQLAAGY